MLTFLGLITTAGGLFLFLWYRTVASLPFSRRPPFIHGTIFKWGIPASAALLLALGALLLWQIGPWLVLAVLGMAGLLAFLAIRFDRFSASMRLIHDRYAKIRGANPDMDELEVFYHTAQWRYPEWPHDRLVELVTGKDIEGLLLLMILSENKINPISDWELYRSLKEAAARIANAK